MTKEFTLIVCMLTVSCFAFAQTIVNTLPGPRKAILEEFTGVNCPNCPEGHVAMESVLTSHGADEVFSISYCPSNSSYTAPSGNQSDFRRPFLNDFYAHSYCSPATETRFMPSAFVNRKIWEGGERIQNRHLWGDYADEVLASGNSPMNIGIHSNYNAVTQVLTVDVEIYYHTDVTDANSFYVFLGERNLTSYSQSGTFQDPYIYEHNVFRETLTSGTWGDAVTGPTTSGSLFSTQFTFYMANAIDPMQLSNLDVLAFIIEDQSTEIYTGIQVAADGGTASTGAGNVGINDVATDQFGLFPNPATHTITLNAVMEDALISIVNSVGQTIAHIPNTGKITHYSIAHLPQGVYFVNTISGSEVRSLKLIKL